MRGSIALFVTVFSVWSWIINAYTAEPTARSPHYSKDAPYNSRTQELADIILGTVEDTKNCSDSQLGVAGLTSHASDDTIVSCQIAMHMHIDDDTRCVLSCQVDGHEVPIPGSVAKDECRNKSNCDLETTQCINTLESHVCKCRKDLVPVFDWNTSSLLNHVNNTVYTTKNTHRNISGPGEKMLVPMTLKHSRLGWYHDLYHDRFSENTINETNHSAQINLKTPALVTLICIESRKFWEEKKLRMDNIGQITSDKRFCDEKIETVQDQSKKINIEYMNAYTDNKSFLNSFIKVPLPEKQACITTEIFASELSISLRNFEVAACTKLVVYGLPQKSCDTPSDDVCKNSVCLNCYCPKCHVRPLLRGNRCECSCLTTTTTATSWTTGATTYTTSTYRTPGRYTTSTYRTTTYTTTYMTTRTTTYTTSTYRTTRTTTYTTSTYTTNIEEATTTNIDEATTTNIEETYTTNIEEANSTSKPVATTTDAHDSIHDLEQGCQLDWVYDAERFVSFANEGDFLNEQVITRLWVHQNAFTCSLTLNDIAKLSFSVKTKEEPETQKKEPRNETLKIGDFYNIKNGKKVLKNKQQLCNIAFSAKTFKLKRWRSYEIQVTAKWRVQDATRSFSHNTFQWMCHDENQTIISQTEFCNGVRDCPEGNDENPNMCEASDLLKNLSVILSYPIMLLLMISYIVLPKIHYKQSIVKKIKEDFGAENTCLEELQEKVIRRKQFTLKYKKAHSDPSAMKLLVNEMRFNLFNNWNQEHQLEISKWAREIEEDLHNDPEERYKCILTHYKASHPMIDRIANPEGGILGKIGKIGLNSKGLILFLVLVFHIFDYAKDIDVTGVIYHFDIKVLQQVYEQYSDFNFFHLFLSSVQLLFVSHIFNGIYWLLIRQKFIQVNDTQPTYRKRLWNNLPLIPMVLPILLFCRRAELTRATACPHMDQDAWVVAIDELNVLERIANDVKIIEVVFELFGQMIIQIILILRFRWLVSKPNLISFGFSFGVTFKTFMLVTMGISFFFGIIPSLFTYHRRNRENLRQYCSISTGLILLMWNLIFFTKILVYTIGFQNTPILFWVPVFTYMFLSFLLLTKYEPRFSSLEKHDKLIHVFASFLVPISLPSDKQGSSMAVVYGISLITFCIECLSILCFAILMNNFYTLKGFKQANKELPKLVNMTGVVTEFDNLCYMTAVLVVVVTIISAALIHLYSTFFHPSRKLFRSQSQPTENKAIDMSTEVGQVVTELPTILTHQKSNQEDKMSPILNKLQMVHAESKLDMPDCLITATKGDCNPHHYRKEHYETKYRLSKKEENELLNSTLKNIRRNSF